ncbi:MAG: hypothetical protein ACFFCI_09300 [Promethearchaeota archaeon]
MENKKIETIRVNEVLAQILEDVPKGTSYANWILDKIQRLDAHEQNAICWVVSSNDIGPNRMSVGDENGAHPIFDEIIYITSEIPKTNMSHEEREKGWLGQCDDGSDYAHGGFASIESAKTYITEYMGARLITNNELLEEHWEYIPEEEQHELYTTAEFDEYWFVGDWFGVDEPDVAELTDGEIENLAEKFEKEANADGIGILGDIEEYLLNLREEWQEEVESKIVEIADKYLREIKYELNDTTYDVFLRELLNDFNEVENLEEEIKDRIDALKLEYDLEKRITFEEFAEASLSEETIDKVPEDIYNSLEKRTIGQWESYCNAHFGTHF